jgi:DivIVA domain-containing protein
VALDRQDIERRDFPIARRGYDPDAVDAHLRRIADQLAQLERSPRGAETLATAASEQVRAIVEAAENTSAEITRQADDEARSIRDEAASDAERTRTDAASQAREHVANVSEATKVMLQRVDAMESELGALVESLRTGANRLTADLTLLQGNMGELRAAAGQAEAPRAAEPIVAEPEPELEPVPEPEPELEEEPELEVEEPEPAPEPVPAQAGADSEGARLIALNMALNGTPREETDRYLAENFDLEDRGALLDEVYSRVG